MSKLTKADFWIDEDDNEFSVVCVDEVLFRGTLEECEEERHNAWDCYQEAVCEEQASAQYERDFY
mgnify:CR=1 FL=1